jgi:hypothetical protein
MKISFQFVFAPEHWNNSAVFPETGLIKSTFSEKFFYLFYCALSRSDDMASIQKSSDSEILLTEYISVYV